MNIFIFRTKQLLSSDNYKIEYFILTIIIWILAAIAFFCRKYYSAGDFWWQTLLGLFTGLFVGLIIDMVEKLHNIRFTSLLLSHIQFNESLPVVVANLSSSFNTKSEHQNSDTSSPRTGAGEAITIGLLFSVYASMFSPKDKHRNTSLLHVSIPDTSSETASISYSSQRLIIGGPIYNALTRQFLAREDIVIHYPKDEKGNYSNYLELKDNTGSWVPNKNEHVDFGLIIKSGKQIHISGCRTWGVIGAAKCLFTEVGASQLIRSLKFNNINTIETDYFAVIRCNVPDWNNYYSIGDISIKDVGKMSSQPVAKADRSTCGAAPA